MKDLEQRIEKVENLVSETNDLIMILIQTLSDSEKENLEFLEEFKKVQDIDILRNFQGEA